MTDALSITIVGAGAIGSAVVFSLARAGFSPKLVARGEAVTAIRRDGLRVDKWDGGGTVRLEVTDNPSEIGPQDLVIGTMKAQDWPAALTTLAPLIGPHTVLLPPINGIPWWYFDGQDGPLGGQRIAAVDPDGTLLAALPARSVIGSVVYMGVARVAPGVARWTSGNKFGRGDPLGPLAGWPAGFAEDEFVAAGPPCDAGCDAGDTHIDDGADDRSSRQGRQRSE